MKRLIVLVQTVGAGQDNHMDQNQVWLTVEQIAAHLQVSKETIYRWLEREKIPAHKVGKQWRFLKTEVDEWVLRGEATENPREQSVGDLK